MTIKSSTDIVAASFSIIVGLRVCAVNGVEAYILSIKCEFCRYNVADAMPGKSAISRYFNQHTGSYHRKFGTSSLVEAVLK